MEVNSETIAAVGPAKAAERARARHSAGPLAAADIRSRLQRLSVCHERFERAIGRELDVDAAGLAAMDRLITRGSATPTELARALEISTATMTLVLNRLEASGHITREPHPSDRRKVVVTASRSSTVRAHDSFTPLISGVDSLVNSLSVDDRLVVAGFLEGLLATYDEVTPKP